MVRPHLCWLQYMCTTGYHLWMQALPFTSIHAYPILWPCPSWPRLPTILREIRKVVGPESVGHGHFQGITLTTFRAANSPSMAYPHTTHLAQSCCTTPQTKAHVPGGGNYRGGQRDLSFRPRGASSQAFSCSTAPSERPTVLCCSSSLLGHLFPCSCAR